MKKNNKKEKGRAWRGTWIPKRIWLAKDITWMEKCVLAEIDNLFDEDEGGCWASNEYIASNMDSSQKSISNMISRLKERGYVKQVNFNGRFRILKVIYQENESPPDSGSTIHSAVESA